MTRLRWDMAGRRVYESGVNQGVLYLDGVAVPWTGLTNVVEGFAGDDSEPYYIDGVKYLDSQKIGDYTAVIKAFTYPPEFEEYQGVDSITDGMTLDGQPIKPFHFSYRTMIGSDTQELGSHYKIHIVYNLVATIDIPAYNSRGEAPSILEFSWKVFAMAKPIGAFRPTAHVVIDSRYMNPYLLKSLETMLYGDDTLDAQLPEIDDLVEYVGNWDMVEIRDNGDGTWTATGPSDFVYMLDPTTFQIDGIPVYWVDSDTYRISTTTEV